MKKLLVFLAILFVSVMSSACINNLAIQELNEKAQVYLNAGDYEEAIKRLESSVDLDGSVFETRYNLAVAYLGAGKFDKAIGQLTEAIKINPHNADAYHTLGVAYEDAAYELCGDNNDKDEENADSKETVSDLSAAVNLFQKSISSYEKYIEIAESEEDKQKVGSHIAELREKIAELQTLETSKENSDGGQEQ